MNEIDQDKLLESLGQSVENLQSLLWDLLVPKSGESISMQGEMIRIFGRFDHESWTNINMNWIDAKHDHNASGYPSGYLPDDPYVTDYCPDFSLCKVTQDKLDDTFFDKMLDLLKGWIKTYPLPEWGEAHLDLVLESLEAARPDVPIGVLSQSNLDEYRCQNKDYQIKPSWEESVDCFGLTSSDLEIFAKSQVLYWIFKNPDLVDFKGKPLKNCKRKSAAVMKIFEEEGFLSEEDFKQFECLIPDLKTRFDALKNPINEPVENSDNKIHQEVFNAIYKADINKLREIYSSDTDIDAPISEVDIFVPLTIAFLTIELDSDSFEEALGGVFDIPKIKNISPDKRVDVALELIELGADINLGMLLAVSFLGIALLNSDRLAQKMLAKGIDLVSCAPDAVLVASSMGHYEYVEQFLKDGIDINYENQSGKTALLFVAMSRENDEPLSGEEQSKRIKTMKILLKNGAELNHIDSNGLSAHKIASVHGNSKIVEFLVEAGFNLD